jgi:F-type H+-transporting ATPase subunit c
MKVATLLKVAGLALAFLLLSATPAFAQEKNLQSVSFSGAGLAAGLGMGLTIIGAGYGLGKIGAAALEAMARQPEVAPRVQTAMIIVAAMLEGATLASVALCFVVGLSATF